MNYSNQQNQTIVLKSGKQIRQFYVDQILYVSTSAYVSSIHLANTNKTESFSILLKNLEELLEPYGFVRINRNELINMKYFKKLQEKQKRVVVLQNDQELMISHRKMSSIRQFLRSYI
ncbi:hypothetical protein BKI52_10420 [marine bacterium AO1-C]|nr:hypothetical protein BKI52_10420 [marine bacterium AO1-C]